MQETENKSILAKNIRYYMAQHGKSRNDLCKALDVKYTTLTDWVNGKSYPHMDKIERMARYFGVEKSDLVDDRSRIPADAIPYRSRSTRPIPLLGAVNCGKPLLAEDSIEGYLETPLEDLTSGEAYFWLRTKGESMANIGIREGDLLLIRCQDDVDSGDIAVVSVNGDEATLKRVIKKENALILQPENPAYETRIFVGAEMAEVRIRGRLMKLEKRF